MTLDQYISLCNVIDKIGFKVMVSKIRPLLDKLISLYQNMFVQDKLISVDNAIQASELINTIRKKKKGKGALTYITVLKLDLSKGAYEKISWTFLETVLQYMNFHSHC